MRAVVKQSRAIAGAERAGDVNQALEARWQGQDIAEVPVLHSKMAITRSAKTWRAAGS